MWEGSNSIHSNHYCCCCCLSVGKRLVVNRRLGIDVNRDQTIREILLAAGGTRQARRRPIDYQHLVGTRVNSNRRRRRLYRCRRRWCGSNAAAAAARCSLILFGWARRRSKATDTSSSSSSAVGRWANAHSTSSAALPSPPSALRHDRDPSKPDWSSSNCC